METHFREEGARVLVLGAGAAQLSLLGSARERGFWTAVADRDPGAPGFALAARRCIVSIEDEPALERLAAALDLDGLIAPGSDRAVAVAARVAEKAGLAHPLSPATAVLATNKVRQRERLDTAGVPQPRWELVTDGLPGLPPPWVVKAPDRHGRRGLTVVLHERDLPEAIERARAETRGDVVLVEELVPGREVTVIGLSSDGEFAALAVFDGLATPRAASPAPHGHSLLLGPAGPAARAAGQAVTALGIENGPSSVHVKIGPRGPRVVAVAARLGGGPDSDLVRAATGVDLNYLALLAALGERTLLRNAYAS